MRSAARLRTRTYAEAQALYVDLFPSNLPCIHLRGAEQLAQAFHLDGGGPRAEPVQMSGRARVVALRDDFTSFSVRTCAQDPLDASAAAAAEEGDEEGSLPDITDDSGLDTGLWRHVVFRQRDGFLGCSYCAHFWRRDCVHILAVLEFVSGADTKLQFNARASRAPKVAEEKIADDAFDADSPDAKEAAGCLGGSWPGDMAPIRTLPIYASVSRETQPVLYPVLVSSWCDNGAGCVYSCACKAPEGKEAQVRESEVRTGSHGLGLNKSMDLILYP